MLEEKDLQAIAQLMDSRIGESEKRMAKLMDQSLAQQKQEILDESTQRMKILLDTEITPKFNLLAENQKIMLDKLAPKSELEELLGCSVDLIRIREHMNSRLKQRILNEGVYV